MNSQPLALSPTDRAALRELVDRYAMCMDTRDAAGAASLFTDDARMLTYATGDVTGEPTSTRHGREAIAEAPRWLGETFILTSHFVGQQLLEAYGENEARGTVYCIASHIWVDEAGGRHNSEVHLRYFDTHARIDGSWLFRERRLCMDFVEERPVTVGFRGPWSTS